MSHFSKTVLQDYVRDGFIVEDQTALCRQIFPPPVPKCRPGGIPILQSDKEESCFDSGSPEFEIDINGFRKKQNLCSQQIEEKDEGTDSELSESVGVRFNILQTQRDVIENHDDKNDLIEG